MSNNELANNKPARAIVILFACFAIASYFYAIITTTYNGDFIGFPVQLPNILLLTNLFLCLVPFYIIWIIFKRFKEKRAKRSISVRVKYIEILFYFLFAWQLFLILVFRVGKMESDVYSAPLLLTPIIQITNRISLTFLYALLALSTRSNIKFLFLTILMIILSLSKASLGGFLFISLVGIIKYFEWLIHLIKKNKLLVICALLAFPFFIEFAYQLRSSLRGIGLDKENKNIVTGVLVGRLSSFSNSAQIFEQPGVFLIGLNEIEPFYFQKQAIGGLISSEFLPKLTPEMMLIEIKTGTKVSNSSYMAGTQGNLILSFLKSPIILIINLFSMLFFIWITFKIVSILRLSGTSEISLLISIYPTMSGVANEFASLFFTPLLVGIICLVINTVSKLKDNTY